MDNLADIARHLKIERRWLAEGIPPMRLDNPEEDRDEYRRYTAWGFREAPEDGGRDYGNANVWSLDPGLDVLVREVLQNAKERFAIAMRFAVVRYLGLPAFGKQLVGRLFPKPEQEDLRQELRYYYSERLTPVVEKQLAEGQGVEPALR